MIYISSLDHLISYLTLLGSRPVKLDDKSIIVSNNLILVYDQDYVIPTGFNDGFVYEFCSNIGNLLPTYL